MEWSGREDLNLRPQRPERCALPNCATPRLGPPRSHDRAETEVYVTRRDRSLASTGGGAESQLGSGV
jgi:hypothetical protein